MFLTGYCDFAQYDKQLQTPTTRCVIPRVVAESRAIKQVPHHQIVIPLKNGIQ
jgi:hypothetical protein